MQLKEIAKIIFSFPEKAKGNLAYATKWITAGSLMPDNYIGGIKEDAAILPCEDLLISYQDIIIKRINPQFVNYISFNETKVYASSNLIIVRINKKCVSQYIAYLLEKGINKLRQEISGTVMPSISRKSITEFDIGELPPLNKQLAIGELWRLQKEKNKLTDELNLKETLALQYKLDKASGR